MRTFSCSTKDGRSSTPTQSYILAADEQRARELARRELLGRTQPASMEIRENGRLLCVERSARSEPPAPDRSARRGWRRPRAWR
jgi:hypothetical protein